MVFRLLLVDDDSAFLRTTQLLLEGVGYQVDIADSGERAVELVKAQPSAYALVVLDYRMGQMDGCNSLLALHTLNPDIYVLIYSGDCSRDALHLSWQAGAVGFLQKGRPVEELLEAVANWCRKYEETFGVVPPSIEDASLAEVKMVGQSSALKSVASKVARYRSVGQNVLILGDTGTGKELVARGLRASADSAFLAVNCAAYRGSTDLLESELFGYEKGAFTGAIQEKKGIFESANGGTIFLDEIHQLGLDAQAKLLRAIQEKSVRRVGSAHERQVQFRLVCAAKPDLEERCEKGEFLLDLFHRISVLTIQIPPLRERREDIAPLVNHFCERFEKETGQSKRFLLRTLKYLEQYDWPGNVRELDNTVYHVLTDSPHSRIAPEQLDPKFFRSRPAATTQTYQDLKHQLEATEKDYILEVLKTAKSKSDAARRLKISPTTLHGILQRLGV